MSQDLDFLHYWGRELFRGEFRYLALSGGINNFVYKISNGEKAFVIKAYPERKNSNDARMRAETTFLNYAQKVAPLYVPSVIEVDLTRRCVVLEYVDGNPYDPAVGVKDSDVKHLADFLAALNLERRVAKGCIMHSAIDGFLCISEHMANIQTRIDSLQTSHLPQETRHQCEILLLELRRDWELEKVHVENQIRNGSFTDEVSEQTTIISPSDLGFHNAIKNNAGAPTFIDFEFAGLDDPSKTLSDIFLQPRIPVDSVHLKYFREFFKPAISTKEQARRFHALFCLLKIKWRTIILSFLNPGRMNELLQNSSKQTREKIIAERLKLATDYTKKEHAIDLY